MHFISDRTCNQTKLVGQDEQNGFGGWLIKKIYFNPIFNNNKRNENKI